MVVGIIIAVIVLLVILIVVINHEGNTASAFAEAKKEKSTSTLKYTQSTGMGGEKNPQPVKSLDALYAEKNGLWVCKDCETLNQKGSLRCAACGEER